MLVVAARGGSAGAWVLQADVPDGIITLAVDDLVGRVTGLRAAVADAGVGYLGVMAGEAAGRAAVIVVAIAAAAVEFQAGTDPAGVLAAMLRRAYPQAIVEEFATASGTGVGLRRWERRHLSFGIDDDLSAGAAQALVPFADAGLLGAVTAFCFAAEDMDMATVLTAAIAHRMRVLPA